MPGRLVDQLVDAGLVTEAQARASDAGDPLVPSGRVAQSLVAAGLDERTLAGFFVGLGFGPMLRARELARADADLVRRVPRDVARDLCAMPLRPSRVGAIVAMADPTDERSVAKLSERSGTAFYRRSRSSRIFSRRSTAPIPPEPSTLVSDPLALARTRSATPTGAVPLVNAQARGRHRKNLAFVRRDAFRARFDGEPCLGSRVEPLDAEREVSLTPKATHIPLPRLSTTLTPHAFAPPSATPHPAPPVSSRRNRPAPASLRGA